MAILGGAILLLALLELASILFVPCLLGLFYLKYKLSHPTGEQWEQYFKTISNCGYLVRFYAICLVPLLAVSALGYFLFGLFGFQHPALLGRADLCVGRGTNHAEAQAPQAGAVGKALFSCGGWR